MSEVNTEFNISPVGDDCWMNRDCSVYIMADEPKDAEFIVNYLDGLKQENQRLTEIAARHAARADELYEALDNLLSKQHKYKPHCKRHGIAHYFISHHDFEAARRVLRKTHCNAPD